MRQIPLRLHKASSVHKAQGITVGRGEDFSCVAVAYGVGRQSTPGLDLVATSRAKEHEVLAIVESPGKPLTRDYLHRVGSTPAAQRKQEQLRTLQDQEAETMPNVVQFIIDQDPNETKTFAGAIKCLQNWFRDEYGARYPELGTRKHRDAD